MLSNVNEFIRGKGPEQILARIENQEPNQKISLPVLCDFVFLFEKVFSFFSDFSSIFKSFEATKENK